LLLGAFLPKTEDGTIVGIAIPNAAVFKVLFRNSLLSMIEY
jgi:hypothetical protein